MNASSICDSYRVVAEPPNTTERDVLIALLVISVLVAVFNFTIFFLVKKLYRFERMKVRLPLIVLCFSLSILCLILAFIVPLLTQGFPCWLQAALFILVMGFQSAASFTRQILFILMTRLAYITYDCGKIPVEEASAEEEKLNGLNGRARIAFHLGLIAFSFRMYLSPYTTMRSKVSQILSCCPRGGLHGVLGFFGVKAVLFSNVYRVYTEFWRLQI
jgi:hypothetical protein